MQIYKHGNSFRAKGMSFLYQETLTLDNKTLKTAVNLKFTAV